jgi:hypothetical protein
MLKEIRHNNKIIAIIIYKSFEKDGIHFFTPDNYSQQLAYMKHPADTIIKPHVHNLLVRTVEYTQEVLFIRKGKIRVDLFDDNKNYLESYILNDNDTVFFAHGGHGIKILEEAEIIEVKQGPYAGDNDKAKFDLIDENKVILISEEQK